MTEKNTELEASEGREASECSALLSSAADYIDALIMRLREEAQDDPDSLLYQAADEIDRLKTKLNTSELENLIWHVAHDENGVSWDRARELAENYIGT